MKKREKTCKIYEICKDWKEGRKKSLGKIWKKEILFFKALKSVNLVITKEPEKKENFWKDIGKRGKEFVGLKINTEKKGKMEKGNWRYKKSIMKKREKTCKIYEMCKIWNKRLKKS